MFRVHDGDGTKCKIVQPDVGSSIVMSTLRTTVSVARERYYSWVIEYFIEVAIVGTIRRDRRR